MGTASLSRGTFLYQLLALGFVGYIVRTCSIFPQRWSRLHIGVLGVSLKWKPQESDSQPISGRKCFRPSQISGTPRMVPIYTKRGCPKGHTNQKARVPLEPHLKKGFPLASYMEPTRKKQMSRSLSSLCFIPTVGGTFILHNKSGLPLRMPKNPTLPQQKTRVPWT